MLHETVIVTVSLCRVIFQEAAPDSSQIAPGPPHLSSYGHSEDAEEPKIGTKKRQPRFSYLEIKLGGVE
jgi:hypothetical protein